MGLNFFYEIRGVKLIWKKIRGLKIYSEKIRGLKILGCSEENTPGGYSPSKMTTPLRNSYNIFQKTGVRVSMGVYTCLQFI